MQLASASNGRCRLVALFGGRLFQQHQVSPTHGMRLPCCFRVVRHNATSHKFTWGLVEKTCVVLLVCFSNRRLQCLVRKHFNFATTIAQGSAIGEVRMRLDDGPICACLAGLAAILRLHRVVSCSLVVGRGIVSLRSKPGFIDSCSSMTC